jgi:uncharacterized membrane protein
MFSQFLMLIVDRNAGVIDSLRLSKQLTDGNKVTLFVISLLGFLLMMAGVLALCVGALVAGAFLTLLRPVVYLLLSGQPTASPIQQTPMIS